MTQTTLTTSKSLTDESGCDMIDGVREVPLRSLAPGRRFELVLNATTPWPHKRLPGTVIRHGPGTTAVVMDHAEKERSFTTAEGQVIILHTTGGVQYWSPGTAVIPLFLNERIPGLKVQAPATRDISKWTSKGGTGIGLTPEAESEYEVQERESAMAQATATGTKERVASLPLPGTAATKTDKAKNAAPKPPKAPKAPKELHGCLCGCGEMVAGRFRQGHDGRYYSILKKVAAGEMQFNEMPRAMQEAQRNVAGVKKTLEASKH
jgi:hypothetical protein